LCPFLFIFSIRFHFLFALSSWLLPDLLFAKKQPAGVRRCNNPQGTAVQLCLTKKEKKNKEKNRTQK